MSQHYSFFFNYDQYVLPCMQASLLIFEVFLLGIGKGLKFKQSKEIKSKSEKYETGRWTTEVFIPWKSIGVQRVQAGDIFRANFFRIDGFPKQDSFQTGAPRVVFFVWIRRRCYDDCNGRTTGK